MTRRRSSVGQQLPVCLTVLLLTIAMQGSGIAKTGPAAKPRLRTVAARSGGASSAQTAETGPRIWLQDSRRMTVRHSGSLRAMQSLRSGQAQPLAMAQGDIDGNGIQDLVAGYAAPSGGVLAFYRGNLDAFAPQSDASLQAIGRGDFPSPFLADAETLEVPVRPDFVAVGAFSGSGMPDVVVAARGSSSFYLIANDGHGNFTEPKAIAVGGPITAVAAGELGRTGAYGQLLIGISDRSGSFVMAYTGTEDGLKGLAALPIPAATSRFEFGNFGDGGSDAAFVAGGNVYILRAAAMQLMQVPVTASAHAIALGNFIYDRTGGLQIAILNSDGGVEIAARTEFDPRKYSDDEFRAIRQARRRGERSPLLPDQHFPEGGWKIAESIPHVSAVATDQEAMFFRTRISDHGADDVMWLNASNGRMAVISHPDQGAGESFLAAQVSVKPYSGAPVAAMAMRVNIDGRPGVVALHRGDASPFVVMPIPDPTFFVNRTDDPTPASPITNACNNTSNADVSSSCSLREAVLRANATLGTDTIQLAAGTYTLSRAKVANDFTGNNGALYVNDSVNIVGAGQATTIIQAGTTSANGVDQVMAVNEDLNPITAATASISNLTMKFGRNIGVHGADGDGGCMMFDTGSAGTANLTLTNVTLTDCSTTTGNGGGIAVYNIASSTGLATFANSIIQNNSAVDSTTAVGAAGGGIMVFDAARISMTNTQVLNNKATQVNGTGLGQGGGIFIYSSGPNSRQSVIHGSPINGNKAAGSGGGIASSSNLLVDQGSAISGNIAGTDGTNPVAGQLGGGLYLNTSNNGCPGACTDTTTISKVVIVGNTATGNGGGIALGNGSGGGSLTMNFSRLSANTAAAGANLYDDHSVATVTNDWWGTNLPANTISSSSGTVTFDPYIALTHAASPAKIRINQTTTLTADMSKDNHGSGAALTGNLNVIVGAPITFNGATLGSISNAQTTLNSSAQATATFTAGNASGRGSANATVDQVVASANASLISAASEAANTVTIATVGAHGFSAGQTVVISGVGVSGYNGTFVIQSVTTNTFTYTNANSGLGASSGGTATVGIVILEPPQITKSFSAATAAINAPFTATFSINNPNVVPINTSFTDTLPNGMQVAATPAATNTCGGTFAPTVGSASLIFTSSSTPVGTCTVTVSLIGTFDNNYTNSVTINSTDAGNGNSSSTNITVINPPHIVSAFGATTIPLNGTTSMTFTIDSNGNINLTQNGVAFTDNLPAGLVVATPSNATTNCPGGTVTAANGSSTVSLAGGSVAPSSSCTVSLNVKGTTAGVKSNSVQVTSSNAGNGNTSTTSLTVVSPPTIAKAFGAATVPLNGTVTVTFTINNPNTTVDLSGVAFSDTLPSTTGTLVVASTPNVSNTCGGTVTASGGTGVISLSGASVTRNTSCTLSVDVKGTAPGDASNTTGAITSNEGGTGTTSNTLTVKVVAPPTIAKAFGATSIQVNGTTTLTLTITNPAANTTAESGIAVSDTLTGGLQVAATPGVSNTCGGSVTAAANSTSISLTGGSITTPGNTCAVTVNVTGTQSGVVSNTTGAVSSTNGGTGATSNTVNLTVASAPSVTKTFSASSIPLNGTTQVNFAIQNPNSNLALTGLAFTDTLPTGLVVAATPGVLNGCGGTLTAVAGASSISLSGGTAAANSSCNIAVNVTGTTAGQKSNSVQVSSNEAGSSNTSTANLTVIAPPTISKTFGAAAIPLNGTTTLSFTLTNPNSAGGLSGIGFSDTLPAGLLIATPNGLTGGCGGTITATQGTNLISLSGAALGAAPSVAGLRSAPRPALTITNSCTFSVNVVGTAAGTQNNVTSSVSSTEGGGGLTASASIKVEGPPSIAKVFSPSAIGLNSTTSLQFTITNPAANPDALAGVAFTDTLPTGLSVGNATATVCGGTLTTTSPTSISLSGASINTNSTCQFSVTVTGNTSGQYTNTTGAVSSTNGGTGNTATANLVVASPGTTAKAFGAGSIPLNGITTLTITVGNPNAGVAFTGVQFTDSLPSGLLVAATPNLQNTCGGSATAVGGSGSVTLSAGTLAASGNCSVSLNVTGTTAGVKNNLVQASSTEAGPGTVGTASVTVVAPPTLSKQFGAAAIPVNGSTTLSFTVTNPNSTVGLSGIGFSDTLPTGLVISTPNGLTGSCTGGTITATQGTNVISLSGASLSTATMAGLLIRPLAAITNSCTFSVNVTGVAAGALTNTTGAVTSTEGGTGSAASASIHVEGPPSIAKVFNPSSIALNGTTSLQFTITNPVANPDALAGVAFTDTLPTGLTVANATATVCGGTLTTTSPTSISLSGASINANSNCQFAVTVTGTTSGQYTNTTGNVSSTNGGTGNTASANLSVGLPPTIAKAFGAPKIAVNGTTTLTFTIQNPNSGTVTGISFTDSLPAGLVVAATPGLSNTCGGTATATAGATSASLSGGSLTSGGSCVVSLNVRGTTAGVKNNSVTVNSDNGAGNTSNASVTVVAPPTLAKAFGSSSVLLNGNTTLTFTVTNPNSSTTLTGIGFTDTLPSGLVISTPSGFSGSCGGGIINAAAGANFISLSGAQLASSANCTFAVNVTGIAAGTDNNTTSTVSSVEGGSGAVATASTQVVAPPVFTKAFSPSSIPVGGTTTLTFTLSNPAANPTRINKIAFTDTLPTGLTIASSSVSTCSGTLTTTAPTGISFASGALNAGANCQFSVTVTGATAGNYTNVTSAVTTTNAGSASPATASLVVAAPGAPTADSVTPNSGTGLTQTFTYKFSDPAGYASLNNVQVLINGSFTYTGSCGVMFAPGSGSLYLINDAATAWQGPITIAQAGTLTNSQCTLNGASSSFSGSGTTLTLNLAITFKSGFSGTKSQWGLAADNGGQNSPWTKLGTWAPSAAGPPTVVSVTPNSGSGVSQTFAYQFSDTAGYTSIGSVQMLINGAFSYTGSCGVMFTPGNQFLYLINDAANAWQGPMAIGQAGTLSNSQCTLNGATSSFTGSGTNLTVNLALTFNSGFSGAKTQWGLAADNAGQDSGWIRVGSWTTVAVGPPTVVSVTPNSGTGLSQTFAYQFSDAGGYATIGTVQMLINGGFTYTGSCGVMYTPGNQFLYLINDAANAWQGPIAIGQAGSLSNSQCTLNGATSSSSGSGNTLTVNLALTFNGGFSGTKTQFAVASDNGGQNSAWTNLGTWTPQ